MAAIGDLLAIKKGPTTGSGKTEVHILATGLAYQFGAYNPHVPTSLELTDTGQHGVEWAFAVGANDDLLAIKKGPTTGSGKTEVHIVSAASQYTQFAPASHFPTPLELTDTGQHGVEWAFAVGANGDLLAIKKGPTTGSGKTEVHIVSAASQYTQFAPASHFPTPLELTSTGQHGVEWAFAVGANDDLLAIKKGPTTGSGKTEVHIVSAASQYTQFAPASHFPTPLELTDTRQHGVEWEFVVAPGRLLA